MPALGNLIFTLNPTGVKASDDYLAYAFGGEVNHQITPELGVYAGADVRARSNMTQDQFDSTSLDVRAGVAMGAGRQRGPLRSSWPEDTNWTARPTATPMASMPNGVTCSTRPTS